MAERRGGQLVGQPSTTDRQKPKVRAEERRLVARVVHMEWQDRRFAYRRFWAFLGRKGLAG